MFSCSIQEHRHWDTTKRTENQVDMNWKMNCELGLHGCVGFPDVRGSFWRVSKMRIIVYWGLFWNALFTEKNLHVVFSRSACGAHTRLMIREFSGLISGLTDKPLLNEIYGTHNETSWHRWWTFMGLCSLSTSSQL